MSGIIIGFVYGNVKEIVILGSASPSLHDSSEPPHQTHNLPPTIRALYGPGWTSFASPPSFDEAMNQENAVILPEYIQVLRRELMRLLVATFCWHPAGLTWELQAGGAGRGGDPD